MKDLRALAVVAGALAVGYLSGWDLGFAWIDQLHDMADSLAWIEAGHLLPPRGTTVSGLGHNGPWSTFMTMFALRLWSAEWALAAWATFGTLLAVATGLWLAVRRQQPAVAWSILLVWTQPHLWEWSRVGLDLSFAPLPALGLMVGVAAAGRRPMLAAAAGFAGALVAQSHPSLFPAVAVVLVAALRVGDMRGSIVRWGLALAGGGLAFAGVLIGEQLGVGDLRWLGPIGQLRQWPALLDAPGRALAVRMAAADYGSLGMLLRAAGWLLPTALVAQAARGRAGRPALVALAAAAASLLALGYDERTHYHHLMHWDGWLAALAVGVAWTFAGTRAGRALLWALLTLQIATVVVLQREAARDGIVRLSGTFALHEPGRLEPAATWRLRRELWATLDRSSAVAAADRARVGGDAALPLAEHGWWSPFDPPGASAPGGAWLLHDCRTGDVPLVGQLCLSVARQAAPWMLVDREGATVSADLSDWRLRGEMPGPGRAHLPVLAVPRERFPLRLSPTDTTAAGEWTVRLRTPRHPLAVAADGRTELTLFLDGRPVTPVRLQTGYILDEAVYRLGGREIELRLTGDDPRPAAFDIFVDPRAPAPMPGR